MMIPLLTCGLIGLFIFCFIIGNKMSKVEKLLSKNPPKKGDLVLPALKQMPTIDDVDPNFQLLKDCIETAKLENWVAEIEQESMFGISYSFKIHNHSKSLWFIGMLRTHEHDIPRIGYFSIVKQSTATNNDGESVGYEISENEEKDKVKYYLLLEYLWSLVVTKNENDYNVRLDSYTKSKSIIEKELTTLRRNKQLEKLFEDNSNKNEN